MIHEQLIFDAVMHGCVMYHMRRFQVELGDLVLEMNGIPIHSADDIAALVELADKSIQFLVKKTPQHELKRYGIPNTPSLRKQVI